MKLLLDSHALIWAACDPAQLSERVQKALRNQENRVSFSAVSMWEIALKYAIGKLVLEGMTPDQLHQAGLRMGFEALPLLPETAGGFHALPRHGHKDPFDRMLAWQAICEKHVLVTRDTGFKAYAKCGLRICW